MPNIRKIKYKGVTRPLKDTAKLVGIPASTIAARLAAHWDLNRALTTPPERKFARGGRKKLGAVRACPELREHHAKKGKACCRWWEHGVEHLRMFGDWGAEES